MIHMQNTKLHSFIRPLDINGTTATDAECDTTGYDYMTVYFRTGNVAADMTALKLQESDTSGSGEADISGGAWSTFPLASGGDNTTRIGFLDLRKRKKYISVVATAGAGATVVDCFAILSRAELSPIDVTGRGVDQQIIL